MNYSISPKRIRCLPSEVFSRNNLLKLKLITLALFLSLSCCWAKSEAQISLREMNTTLDRVLQKVHKLTGYEFIYEEGILGDSKLDVELSNMSLEHILHKLLKGRDLSFSTYGSTIVIIPYLMPSPSITDTVVEQTGTFNGTVVDAESRKPIRGVTFLIQSNRVGSVSDGKGRFVLRYPSSSDIVTITCVGYKTRVMRIQEIIKSASLPLTKSEFKIDEAVVRHRNTKNVTLDLSRRRHLNLSQVLEGSVPGIVIKPVVKTNQQLHITTIGSNPGGITDQRELYDYLKRTNPAMLKDFPTYEDYERRLFQDWPLMTKYRGDNVALEKSTTFSGIELESRGGSVFPGSTKGMLILVDGFPQKDFPANMPMSNVESIDVIRDPEECIKYGPEGLNGVILIKTMVGKNGKPEVKYTTNIYLSARPDNRLKSLDLATSSDLLDFYMEQYQKSILPFVFDKFPESRVPYAYNLMYDWYAQKISEEVFNQKWDSLSMIDNSAQMRELQQNRFMQQHNLTFSGARASLRYNFNALYTSQRQETRGGSSRNLDLNTNNQFQFFSNKVNGQIFARLNRSSSNIPKKGFGDLPPYQLLLDEQNNYIYEYGDTFREDIDSRYVSSGLLSHGRNLLEDQLLNFDQNKVNQISGFAKLNYHINRDLTWINSFLYQDSRSENIDFTAFQSTAGRRYYNQYTVLNRDQTLTPWLPELDYGVFSAVGSKTMDARSGFAFEKKLGTKHLIEAGASFWYSMRRFNVDSTFRLFGIDRHGNGGESLQLEETSGTNSYRERILTNALTLQQQLMNQQNRNLKFAGNLGYHYRELLKMKWQYNAAFIPNFGEKPNYAGFHESFLETDWDLHKQFRLSNRILTQLAWRNKSGILRTSELPVRQTATRSIVSAWQFYHIHLSDYLRTDMSDIDLNYTKNTLYMSLLEGDLMLSAGAYLSNKNQLRWTGDIAFDLKRRLFPKSTFINALRVNYSLQDFDSYQNLMTQLSQNQLTLRSPVQPNFLVVEQLPAAIVNHDISTHLALLGGRMNFDLRYFNRKTSGIVIDAINGADPATGMTVRQVPNTTQSKGIDLMSRFSLFDRPNFVWDITLIASHNTLKNLDVPELSYMPDRSYLSTQRVGYSPSALWSYRWGGLNEKGDPTILNANGDQILIPEQSALVYSGVTSPTFTGSFNQTFEIYDFFIRTRLNWQAGAVARKYKPAPSGEYEYNADIATRWKKAGDEAITDIPALQNYDINRVLITQNSSNSILSTDALRLEELQLGYYVPKKTAAALRLKELTVSVQATNVWFKARNKYGFDPRSMSTSGILIPRMPTEFSFTLNAAL